LQGILAASLQANDNARAAAAAAAVLVRCGITCQQLLLPLHLEAAQQLLQQHGWHRPGLLLRLLLLLLLALALGRIVEVGFAQQYRLRSGWGVWQMLVKEAW
jgi:uncharacterized membrane protein YdjX (TVP38/TMEM64 family)